MAMNREMKRMAQRQDDDDAAEGEPTRKARPAPASSGPVVEKDAWVLSRQGLREVRAELRKVAWPSRTETINYSVIVLVTLVVLTLLIFGIDWVVSKAVLKIFET